MSSTVTSISNTKKLAGRTLFITGASRGIGLAIALKAAKDGANIVIAAKTAEPHPKLPGTIYTAAKEIEDAGGQALPCIVDVRYEDQVKAAVKKAVERFGGIDILINNASAISLTSTQDTDMKRYDLMHNINTRGTFLVSKECIPYLLKSDHAHILNMSSPLNMSKHWFSQHLAYTMAKYGMSMCVLGMAEEFRDRIAVNALWPKTGISTAATGFLGGAESNAFCRTTDIMADAAYVILCKNARELSGKFLIDENVLRDVGVTDFDQYACVPENSKNIRLSFFIDGGNDSTEFDRIVGNLPDVNGSFDDLFEKLSKRFSTDLVRNIDATYVFYGKDSNNNGSNVDEVWHIDMKNGAGKYGKGNILDLSVKTDIVIRTMNRKILYNLLDGKLPITTLFTAGRNSVRMAGDKEKILKLNLLIGNSKAKL